jgi:hypothetical protein
MKDEIIWHADHVTWKTYFKEFTQYTEQYFRGEYCRKEAMLGNAREMQQLDQNAR